MSDNSDNLAFTSSEPKLEDTALKKGHECSLKVGSEMKCNLFSSTEDDTKSSSREGSFGEGYQISFLSSCSSSDDEDTEAVKNSKHRKIKNSLINHNVIFDRIELGTYMIASALQVKNNITINKIDPKIIKSEIDILKKIGVKIKQKKTSIIIKKNKKLKKINISTKPYPGFPTDLQAQLMVLLTQANGVSKIREDIFENRFMHVPELKRMGADIEIRNKTAIIKGPTKLTGAEVMATDLRASVSLVLAGLVAENRTIINRIYHLDRGYEFLESKLKSCKAEIKRV